MSGELRRGPATDALAAGAKIRVLIVDDHDLYRTGLASLLASEPDLEVVAHTSAGHRGVRLASELRPDVVLMDLVMPGLDGVEATRQIVAQNPATAVLVLTVVSDEDSIRSALEAGACGLIAKDTPLETLASAIRAAAEGAAWLSPRAAEVVLSRIRREGLTRAPGQPPEALSTRELEVLRLVAAGMGNAQIAEALGISSRTVKNHVSRILAKLGLPGRVQAAVYAVRSGLD